MKKAQLTENLPASGAGKTCRVLRVKFRLKSKVSCAIMNKNTFIEWRCKTMKYESAYFCGYAKLPSALPTTVTNSSLTLGLLIELKSGKILDTSVTLLSPLAIRMVTSYTLGRNIVDDFEEMCDEILCRHQGVAAKPLVKALGDIHRNYLEYIQRDKL